MPDEELIEHVTKALTASLNGCPSYELLQRMHTLTPDGRARLAYALRDVTHAVTGLDQPKPAICPSLLIVDREA